MAYKGNVSDMSPVWTERTSSLRCVLSLGVNACVFVCTTGGTRRRFEPTTSIIRAIILCMCVCTYLCEGIHTLEKFRSPYKQVERFPFTTTCQATESESDDGIVVVSPHNAAPDPPNHSTPFTYISLDFRVGPTWDFLAYC